MKASRIDNRQEELFQPRLSGQLNQKNELMILSRMIPWDSLESEFSDLYQSNGSVGGQPPANPPDDWNSFAATSSQSFR